MAAKKSGGSGRRTQDANRSSKTGQFVTEKFAKNNPSTTQHERNKIPPPKKGK